MIGVFAVYLLGAWIVASEVARTAPGPLAMVRGLVEAAAWPLVLTVANLGVIVDAVRAWTGRVA